MRIFLSILVIVSVLTGSIGVNLLNSECSCCDGEKVCMCSSSCSIENTETVAKIYSCCGIELIDEDNTVSCCDETAECCTPELIKLDVTLILVFDTQKIEIPHREISRNINQIYSISVLPGECMSQKGIPEKPPPITRLGLDLNCTFLC